MIDQETVDWFDNMNRINSNVKSNDEEEITEFDKWLKELITEDECGQY